MIWLRYSMLKMMIDQLTVSAVSPSIFISFQIFLYAINCNDMLNIYFSVKYLKKERFEILDSPSGSCTDGLLHLLRQVRCSVCVTDNKPEISRLSLDFWCRNEIKSSNWRLNVEMISYCLKTSVFWPTMMEIHQLV